MTSTETFCSGKKKIVCILFWYPAKYFAKHLPTTIFCLTALGNWTLLKTFFTYAGFSLEQTHVHGHNIYHPAHQANHFIS